MLGTKLSKAVESPQVRFVTHQDGVATLYILGVKSHDVAGQLREDVRNLAGLLVPGSAVWVPRPNLLAAQLRVNLLNISAKIFKIYANSSHK